MNTHDAIIIISYAMHHGIYLYPLQFLQFTYINVSALYTPYEEKYN